MNFKEALQRGRLKQLAIVKGTGDGRIDTFRHAKA